MSEIDPFARAVLKHHYPDVQLHGDFTKGGFDGSVDVLVGGTPCQSFSIAGCRKGLRDPRGNLAEKFFNLAADLNPSWVVWENVPGVMSIDQGRCFGAILGWLAECGYGFAYRVLDTQYTRVDSFPRAIPQRRRRLFVVGYLGDWRRAAAVLFECPSLLGHSAPRREAREDAADASGIAAKDGLTANALEGGDGGMSGKEGRYLVDARANTLQERDSKGADSDTKTGHLIVDVARPMGSTSGGQRTSDLDGVTIVADPITANEGKTYTHEGNMMRLRNCIAVEHERLFGIAFDQTQITSPGNRSQPSDVSHSLADNTLPPAVASTSMVRRLTPRECERLQGFPDDYTLVQYRGSPAKDTPRYRALGNAMSVNVMRWIGQRIDLVEGLK